jgi:fructokinase
MDKMHNVIGIGELLWDLLPEGKELGGAPCNFVYHAQKQGAKAFALSAIGDDEYGKEILEVLKAKDVSSELIQINGHPTGTVDVALNARGVPSYTIHENVAWDYISFTDKLKQKISQANVVCFGSLAQRNKESQEAIEKILKSCNPDTLIVYDINLRQHFYSKEIIEKSMQLCNVLKLNEEELPVVVDLLELAAGSAEEQILELINRYNLKLVAYTKGEEGSWLLTPHKSNYEPTPKVAVKDTVGAGDSFTAVMIIGFANGESLKKLHCKAIEVSAFVCTKDGAMPEYEQS